MATRKFFYLMLTALGFVTFLSAPPDGISADGGGKVMVITINGSINPISAEYIVESIKKVNAASPYEALVIEMDTPGGLDTSMRQIVKAIQASGAPIIVYVAPSGSRAASAGAFITMAAHLAVMAPGTNIGAASPVNMSGGMDETMKKKVTNDAVAYIRSIAKKHGRNADWGEKFVRKSSSITETSALKNKVIDLLAENMDDLLESIDGRKVKTASGEKTFHTANSAVIRVAMSWRQELFDALANPNIAYMLMMLGFYGLFFELSIPGAILPGVIGAISIILAFYSLQALPINYAGALLMLLAVFLFMLEIWVPSFGVLSIGGIVAMIIGSLMLIDSPDEYLRISLWLIIFGALMTAAFFIFIMGAGLRALTRKVTTGEEAMIGSIGVVELGINPDTPGKIFVEGELWDAVTLRESIGIGTKVEVTKISGLTLTVKPKGNRRNNMQ